MKVSIVTPSYNQGKFIERTLNSVASQSAPGLEIEHVVFDGGSTDNTVEIFKNFKPSVRWVSKKDKGQTDAINQGICNTDGDIIGWLNSDDIYFPKTIQRVIEYLKVNPEMDVVYGEADHIDLEGNALGAYPTEPWDFRRLQETCFICQPALFFRRRVVSQHGLLDELMWFKRNGHRAKSHQNQSEVFDERKKKATKVHEGISARRRQTGNRTGVQQQRGRPTSWDQPVQHIPLGA